MVRCADQALKWSISHLGFCPVHSSRLGHMVTECLKTHYRGGGPPCGSWSGCHQCNHVMWQVIFTWLWWCLPGLSIVKLPFNITSSLSSFVLGAGGGETLSCNSSWPRVQILRFLQMTSDLWSPALTSRAHRLLACAPHSLSFGDGEPAWCLVYIKHSASWATSPTLFLSSSVWPNQLQIALGSMSHRNHMYLQTTAAAANKNLPEADDLGLVNVCLKKWRQSAVTPCGWPLYFFPLF